MSDDVFPFFFRGVKSRGHGEKFSNRKRHSFVSTLPFPRSSLLLLLTPFRDRAFARFLCRTPRNQQVSVDEDSPLVQLFFFSFASVSVFESRPNLRQLDPPPPQLDPARFDR